MLSLEEAKQLKRREVLVDQRGKRWYVNGMVKTWKRDPKRIRVPLKHGLYVYDALETWNFDENGMCDLVTKEQ